MGDDSKHADLDATIAAEASEQGSQEENGDNRDTVGKRIAGFLKAIKPYRDLLALTVAIVVGLSAGISWTTAYFATRAQVFSLECKMYDYIHNSLKPVSSGLGLAHAKWARKEANRLLDDPKRNGAAAKKLLNDAETIEKDQVTADAEAEKQFKADTASCDRGPQSQSSSHP
jgi:hypothetical protein